MSTNAVKSLLLASRILAYVAERVVDGDAAGVIRNVEVGDPDTAAHLAAIIRAAGVPGLNATADGGVIRLAPGEAATGSAVPT